MNKIFFFDIDGTLLPYGQKEVPKSTKYAINELQKNGHQVYIATGKSYEAALPVAKSLGINNLITNNGETIYQNSKLVSKRCINEEDMFLLAQIADRHSLGLGFQGDNDSYLYTNRKFELVSDFFDAVDIKYPRIEQQVDPNFEAGQMWIVGDFTQVQLPAHLKKVAWRFGGCDVMRFDSSKGRAIKDFFTSYEVETFAFGDGENDIEMFHEVDHSVAMENGCESIKQVAKYTCGSDIDDGIYKFLVEHKLIKEQDE